MPQIETLCILGAATLWGAIAVFVKALAAAGLTPIEITALRAFGAALLLFFYLACAKRAALRVAPRDCRYFVGTGVCSLLFFNYCYFSAIEQSSIAVAASLLYTAPMFVALLSAALLSEALTARKCLAAGATLAGCALVSGLEGGAPVSGEALVFGLGSGLGYALYSIFGKYALRRYDAPTISFYTFLFASLGALPFLEPERIVNALAVDGALLCAGSIAALCTVLPYLLYTRGLRNMEAGKASVLATTEPLVAAFLGALCFDETLSATKLAGMGLILGAAALLNHSEKSPLAAAKKAR